MANNLRPRVVSALALAEKEAGALGDDAVNPEHLLLGLMREEDGIAYRALVSLGYTLENLRRNAAALDGHGKNPLPGQIRLGLLGNLSLEFASRAARLGVIDTEHLLLGLIRQQEQNNRSRFAAVLTGLTEYPAQDLKDLEDKVVELAKAAQYSGLLTNKAEILRSLELLLLSHRMRTAAFLEKAGVGNPVARVDAYLQELGIPGLTEESCTSHAADLLDLFNFLKQAVQADKQHDAALLAAIEAFVFGCLRPMWNSIRNPEASPRPEG